MAKLTYTVVQVGSEWVIRLNDAEYTGYRSQESAVTAAKAVAAKLGLNGSDTFVEVRGTDGSTKTVFASDPEPPTIDSMMDAER
ncbi:hypothetical protein [Roseomonas indoligenes]|uniref:DUF2188 domain-containing protein n=1 Tax=Roseomonas indoligenes TaxID=2820811 RepID=A0A940S5X1_9PROT|nr:hypothetical protein [Pararoseomonas indoligenes]MBP0493390.1 hypothetical protein [Pararoseomonas indoligenes]